MKKEFFVSLTFDDGWKSAITNAAPLLARFGMPATFYIISDCVFGCRDEYMNVDDLRALTLAGHEIGAHTKSHKYLTELSQLELWNEIEQGAEDLRALGFDPCTFAYPFGDWNPHVVKQVREAGFMAARTIARGMNTEKTNHLLLRGYGVRKEHSANDVISWIVRAMRSDWLILYFHQIEQAEVLSEHKWIYGTTPAVLEGVLLYLQREHIPIVTVADGI